MLDKSLDSHPSTEEAALPEKHSTVIKIPKIQTLNGPGKRVD